MTPSDRNHPLYLTAVSFIGLGKPCGKGLAKGTTSDWLRGASGWTCFPDHLLMFVGFQLFIKLNQTGSLFEHPKQWCEQR